MKNTWLFRLRRCRVEKTFNSTTLLLLEKKGQAHFCNLFLWSNYSNDGGSLYSISFPVKTKGVILLARLSRSLSIFLYYQFSIGRTKRQIRRSIWRCLMVCWTVVSAPNGMLFDLVYDLHACGCAFRFSQIWERIYLFVCLTEIIVWVFIFCFLLGKFFVWLMEILFYFMWSKPLIKATRTRIEVVRRRAEAKQRFLKEDLAKLLTNGLDINAYGRVRSFLPLMISLLHVFVICCYAAASFCIDSGIWECVYIHILVLSFFFFENLGFDRGLILQVSTSLFQFGTNARTFWWNKIGLRSVLLIR